MRAYLIASVRIKDPQKWGEYTEGAKELIEGCGGSVLVFDKQPTVLVGDFPYSVQVILKFPSQDILQTWFNSDAYKLLVPVRDEGADVLFIAAH